MKTFESLTQNEKNQLLKFPAYISLLAAGADREMDEAEKKEAIHLTHIKTFACEPVLSDFYREAQKVFLANIEKLDQELPKEKKARENAIKEELAKLEVVLSMLGNEYASALHQSMKSYTKHVSKAHNNVLESFIIPLYIKGLTE